MRRQTRRQSEPAGRLRRAAARRRAVAALALITAFLALDGAAGAAATWSPAGDLALARVGAAAIRLDDGRVLVVGGATNVGNGYDTRLAEIYDPAANAWSPTGSTANGRTEHVATRLADGTVLVTGGENANICTNDRTTEIYDPATGAWSFSGTIAQARAGATVTLLGDGRVLLAGGGNRCGSVFSSAELYDPTTGTWSPTGSMTAPRQYHDAVALSDGRVLVVGGLGPFPFPALASAEIYDPATGTWTSTGSMATARCCPGNGYLTQLADGRVLATSGYSGFSNLVVPNGPQAEIFDPATGAWTPTGSMTVGRASASFSLLSDGRVLAAGGTDGTTIHQSAEVWSPGTETWAPTASLATARSGHTATVLLDGSVLVATGYDPPNYLHSAELYTADATAPSITILTPADGASYLLGSTVLADFACEDEPGGSGLASCIGTVASGSAIDTATVGTKAFTVDAADAAGNSGSLTHTYTVVYDFAGFFEPIANVPSLNEMKAGAAAPVKFSLTGDQGLDVLADGYPRSQAIPCDSEAPVEGLEETVTAGSSGLSYDSLLDQYVYVWKTDKAWAGTCRQLVVKLDDGTAHRAKFRFK